jgi:hypothetical protein
MTSFAKHLKSHALGYFQICKDSCALESDNSNPNAKSFFIRLKTLFEWILHPTPMTEQIYSILDCNFLKCQRPFFVTKHSINGHGLTSGRCFANWSWNLLWTDQALIDGLVFDDRPNYLEDSPYIKQNMSYP